MKPKEPGCLIIMVPLAFHTEENTMDTLFIIDEFTDNTPTLAPNDFAHPEAPGTGPADKRCRHCKHYTKVDNGYNYITKRCKLMMEYWYKAGVRVKVKANDPACKRFL
jgi:hypothetical protein